MFCYFYFLFFGCSIPHIHLLLLLSRQVAADSFVTPWTVALQAPQSMGFSRQECWRGLLFLSVCCCYCSVAKLCLTPCNHMDCSMPGFPVLHQLPGFAQTHVHRVGDAIQPFHPLSSPAPPAFNLSQHQCLF